LPRSDNRLFRRELSRHWSDLIDGELLNAINRTAEGLIVDSGLVWTNTDVDATRYGAYGDDCEDWTKTDSRASTYRFRRALRWR